LCHRLRAIHRPQPDDLPRKHLSNDVLDGRVFKVDVVHLDLGEQPGSHFRGLVARHVQYGRQPIARFDGAERGKLLARHGLLELQPQDLVGRDVLDQGAEVAIVEHLALINYNDAVTQCSHVGHVMAGEDDRGAVPAIVFGDEVADAHLHRHVQPDGWLVEKQHFGAMEQRGRQLALHALAQRQLAHLLLEQRLQAEQIVEFFQRRLVLRLGDVVDGLVDEKGLDGRKVPQQLLLLAHDQRELFEVSGLALVRREAHHRRHAAGGVEQAR